MSRAVTRSSSRVRSLTPESAMVPPCDKANFQQRIKSAKNMEPKRSEEHTSELQSLTNLVCRLLLEKKKPKSHRRHSGPTPVQPSVLLHVPAWPPPAYPDYRPQHHYTDHRHTQPQPTHA